MKRVHPIVRQTSPSREQLPAVLARGGDVVVTAGAGTGKTRTLVARYLALLAEGLPLRAIVAITFTRKAAREMRNRVRDEMRRYLEQPALDEGERQRWQRLYTELDAARIGTIHSLCAEILRAHPAEAGVDPGFEVLEEAAAIILQGQAVDETLAWAADNAQTVGLFALCGESGLRGALLSLLRRRLDAEEVLAAVPGDPWAHWREALAGRQERALQGLLERREWRRAVRELRNNRARVPDDLIETQRREAVAAIDGALGTTAERLAALARLGQIRRSGGRTEAWDGGAAQLGLVKEALHVVQNLWKDRPAVLHLALNPLDEAMAQSSPGLRATFSHASARYEALKRERRALDFDDLEGGALRLLRQDPAARAHWQDEVQALLVDEFQDTNGRQRDLVRLLGGERGCIFLVGDGKQSIYRFRGADVRVFRQERARIEQQGGHACALEVSYRAHAELIEGLNCLLRPVLGDIPDPERPWVEPFAPLSPHRKEPLPGFTAPHIELHLTIGSKSSGALARAAGALAQRIRELRESGALQRYEHAAILCRAADSFRPYEDALEQAGLPFLTVAGSGFYRRSEIRDLLNALAALADPTDDLALAGFLRSPVLALSDTALYLLREGRPAERMPLWEALQRPPAALSGEDRGRAARAVRIITALHGMVGRTTVADLLKALLDETAMVAALVRAGQTRSARNVAKLLTDAQASGIVSVGEFLAYVAALRESGAREGEARATAEGAVQIMTVHQAKGLEFPVVAIGDATYSGGGRAGVRLDPHLGIVLPLRDRDDDKARPAVHELASLISDDQDAAESARLLYVAATRAQEKLLISGCIGLASGGRMARAKGWLGRLAEEDILGLCAQEIDHDEEGNTAHSLELRVGQTPVRCTVYEPGWQPAPPLRPQVEPAVPPMALPPPLLAAVAAEPVRVDRRTRESEQPQRVWRVVPSVARPRAPAWVVGALVHAALAVWRFPDEGFGRWAEARARGYGLTDARQLADAVRQTVRLLQRFRASDLFHEMDTSPRRLHEVPYSLEVAGHVESGKIDALYLQGATWTVVEFKTDRIEGEAQLQELLARADYLDQAQRYAIAVERLLGQRPRVLLCLLNYAGTIRCHEPSP